MALPDSVGTERAAAGRERDSPRPAGAEPTAPTATGTTAAFNVARQ